MCLRLEDIKEFFFPTKFKSSQITETEKLKTKRGQSPRVKVNKPKYGLEHI